MRAALCLLVLAAGSAGAQGLRVRIVDDSSGEVVPTAIVTLVRDDAVFAEALTRANGTRFFPADPAGTYRVIVERVGREPWTSPPLTPPADTSTVELRVASAQLRLRADDVREPSRCSDQPAGVAAQIWRQARIALSGVEQVTAESRELLAIHRYERLLGRDGEPRSENTVDARVLGTRLFPVKSPAELSRGGFITTDTLGNPLYLGPEPAYLLAAEFLRDHCFGAVRGSGGTDGMLGLRFTPRPGARVATVAGTLWVDAVTGELRLLDFSYVAPAPATAVAGTGGHVLFELLPSGNWIAREWALRTPVMTQAGQVLGLREQGGEKLGVPADMLAVADSVENARKPPGEITGVVTDSLARRGLAGAVVFTDMAGPRTRSDEEGHFTLRSVPVGFRRVMFTHPMLDSLGVRVPAVPVRVGPDSVSNVNLGTASLATLKGGACADSLAVLTGTVRDATNRRPVDSATVTLSWISIALEPGKPLAVHQSDVAVPTDATGRYAACAPAHLEITAWAEVEGARTGRVDLTPDERGVSVLDLALDRSARDTLTGTSGIHGIVMYQDRTPIPAATVLLTDPERTTTADSLGRFRFDNVPGGTRVLATRAFGHAPVTSVVMASPADTSGVDVYLRRVTQLDAIVVRASAGTAGRAIMELEERRRTGAGYRLTPVELLGFKYAHMDAVVRALPSVRVRTTLNGTRAYLPGPKGRDCSPTLFIDGVRSDEDILYLLSARDMLAVEVFARAEQVPMQYRTWNECGAILLWTREKSRR